MIQSVNNLKIPGCETKEAVVVFAKTPGPGNPKSRIANEAGRERAELIYAELLRTTGAVLKDLDHFVSFAGGKTPGVLKRFFPLARGFLPQSDEPLGDRVRHALSRARDRGYVLLCAIGVDCPDLSAGDIREAFARLREGSDVVIGPAEDGGYYLIALKDPDCGVFSVGGWGGGTLYEQTLAAMKEKGLRYSLLPTKEDIDTLEGYAAWKARGREAGDSR